MTLPELADASLELYTLAAILIGGFVGWWLHGKRRQP